MTKTTRPMSNQEVATRIGLTHTGVSRLRSGSRVASMGTMLKIHEVFRVPVAKLMDTANELRANGNRDPWCDLLRETFVTAEPAPGAKSASSATPKVHEKASA